MCWDLCVFVCFFINVIIIYAIIKDFRKERWKIWQCRGLLCLQLFWHLCEAGTFGIRSVWKKEILNWYLIAVESKESIASFNICKYVCVWRRYYKILTLRLPNIYLREVLSIKKVSWIVIEYQYPNGNTIFLILNL